MRRGKHGFTIVEMLVVIGILAVLMGLVTMAASAAIRRGRVRRADAMRTTIENGLSTYYARFDKWPGKLETWARDGISGQAETGNDKSDHVGTLQDSDYDLVMGELLESNKKGSAVMDFSGLLVGARNAVNGKQHGVDYKTWATRVKAGDVKRMPGGITASRGSITFGYAAENSGRFHRYKIKYNADTDHVSVTK